MSMRQIMEQSRKDEEARIAAAAAPAVKQEEKAVKKESKLPSKSAIKAKLTSVLQKADLSAVTEKKARRQVEEVMGLENKALDVIKKEIGEWINDYLSSKEDNEDEDGDEGEGGGGGDVDGDISDDGIEDMVPTKKKAVAKKKPAASKAAEKKRKASAKKAAPAKKAKKEGNASAAAAAAADGPKPVLTIHTKSGAEPPKKLKELQSDIMTGAEFMRDAAPLEIELFGNTLIGEPRTFTSGNRGWYLGGKIEVEIGGKTVWMSAGLNLVAVGSGQWD